VAPPVRVFPQPCRCTLLTRRPQIVLVIRFSVIPSHFSTAVFSTCDVQFWHFALSTFLTLPKQIILVYFGVLLVQKQDDSVVKTIIFAVAFAITVALGGYIWWKMRRIRGILLEEQAERRQNREMNVLHKANSATAAADAAAGSVDAETATGSTVSLVRRAESPGVSDDAAAGRDLGDGSRRPDPYRPSGPYANDEDAIEPHGGGIYPSQSSRNAR